MAYIKLLKIHYLLAIILCQLLVHYCVSVPIIKLEYDLPIMHLVMIIISSIFTAASGFVICDYYDMRIDEINHPLSRIVGNEIPKSNVMFLYIVLFVSAIISSLFLGIVTKAWDLSFIFLTVLGLLWFYASSYKRTLIVGNIIAALSISTIPFIVALYDGRYILTQWWAEKLSSNGVFVTEQDLMSAVPSVEHIYQVVGYISLYVFMWIFIHEIIRNLYEEEGERELECHTIPIVYGDVIAKKVISLLVILLNLVLIYTLVKNIAALHQNSVSFYICTTFIFSVFLIMMLFKAEYKKDYRICCNLSLLIAILGVVYSLIYAVNNSTMSSIIG